MLAELEQLESDALGQLDGISDVDGLEAWRIAYLGSKGRLKAMMPRLKEVSREEKPAVGKRLNEVKKSLETAFEARKSTASSSASVGPTVDVTEPGIGGGGGCRHVLSRTMAEVAEVFARMGFAIAEGPEVEDERHNFTALNIPPEHPARDEIENFYLAGSEGGLKLLRSQTSTVQIRAMEKQKPPLRVTAIGRVYRPDTHDATHYSMFHQIEGLYIDRGVNMVDLKTVLFQFARTYFGEEAEVRMRPGFFPFTEPSAEIDMKMRVKDEWMWVELGGCGMVHPNVLSSAGIDPEEYTGYAFGLGIERIAMRKYGIPDLRWFYDNDARFLRQF